MCAHARAYDCLLRPNARASVCLYFSARVRVQVKTQETGQDGMCFGVGGGVGRGPDAGRSQGLEEHNAQAGLQVLADRTAIGSASDLEGSACRDFGHLGDLCRVLVVVAVGLQALGDFDRGDEEAKVLPITVVGRGGSGSDTRREA